MQRRHLLSALAGGVIGVAGCAETETTAEPARTTRTRTRSRSATPIAEERSFSRFESYSADQVAIRVSTADLPDGAARDFRIAVFTRVYPHGGTVRRGISERVQHPSDDERTVAIDLEPTREHSDSDEAGSAPSFCHHVAEVRPGWIERVALQPGVGPVLAETDRFRLGARGDIEAAPHPVTVGSKRAGNFDRTAREGGYEIQVEGQERQWRVQLRVFKSSFVDGKTAARTHDYPRYVDAATESGLARRLASRLHAEAEYQDRDPVEVAIEFVQALPYVPEDVAAGADEYIKYPVETLVGGGGDCEDLAILLAAILQAPPYGRDCVLIHPPNHMGVGIRDDGYGGTYYPYEGERYFYVETTGSGWAIGELPAEYADTDALVYQV